MNLAEHRLLVAEKSWDREKSLIILDELHKMTRWKSWLKGIYDVEGIPPGLLVTGSAESHSISKDGGLTCPEDTFSSDCTHWISRK